MAGSDFIQPIEEECAFSVAHREVGRAGVCAGSLIPTAEPTQAGADLFEVSRALGHAGIATTATSTPTGRRRWPSAQPNG